MRGVRFSLGLRGYRMSEVDALLERLAAQLDERPVPARRGPDDRPDGRPGRRLPTGRRAWRRRPDLGHTARMSTEILVYILTPLAAVVVVLTRLRLAGGDAVAGQAQIS